MTPSLTTKIQITTKIEHTLPLRGFVDFESNFQLNLTTKQLNQEAGEGEEEGEGDEGIMSALLDEMDICIVDLEEKVVGRREEGEGGGWSYTPQEPGEYFLIVKHEVFIFFFILFFLILIHLIPFIISRDK